VTVRTNCEELISRLPRHEWELVDEDWDEAGGVITLVAHDLDDTTSAIEWALNMHPGVLTYSVELGDDYDYTQSYDYIHDC